MIFKMFKRGGGNCWDAVNYCLGVKDHTGEFRKEAPQVIIGEPELVAEIANATKFKSKYTSGVLSFTKEEKERLTKDDILDICNSHLEQMTVGIGAERLAATYILHNDHEHLEVHFIAANIDLETRTHFKPFLAQRGDIGRLREWNNLMRLTHNLDNPNAIERKRIVGFTKEHQPKNKKEWHKAINDFAIEEFEAGNFESREELVELILATFEGVEIARGKNPKSISFKHPDWKTNIKFNGSLFELNGEIYNERVEPRKVVEIENRESLERRTREIKEVEQKLRFRIEKILRNYGDRYNRSNKNTTRTDKNVERNKGEFVTATKDVEQESEYEVLGGDFDSDNNFFSDSRIFIQDTIYQVKQSFRKFTSKLDVFNQAAERRKGYFNAQEIGLKKLRKKSKKMRLVEQQVELQKNLENALKIEDEIIIENKLKKLTQNEMARNKMTAERQRKMLEKQNEIDRGFER